MKSLIAKLEAATGPSRELDAEIACEVFFPKLRPAREDDHKPFQRGVPPSHGHIWCPTGFLLADSFTSSLDAARKLGGMLVFASDIGADGLPMVKLVTDTSTTPVIEYTGIAPTLELAWCIAALRARDGGRG